MSSIVNKTSTTLYVLEFGSGSFYDGIRPYEDKDFSKSKDGLVKLEIKDYNIVKVRSGRIHTFLITSEGKVLGFGSNSYGQLGSGFCGQVPKEKRVSVGLSTVAGPLSELNVVEAAGGGYHSLFLTDEYRVFVCGRNENHQCGTNESDKFPTPIELDLSTKFDNCKVVAIGASNSSSCFLTMDYRIYVAGDNTNGSCGGVKTTDRPLRVLANLEIERPFKITCGYDNTVLICESGKCFGTGCNSCGQLAVEDKVHSNFSEFKHCFNQRTDIIDACSGYFGSCLQTLNGEYYYCPSIKNKDIDLAPLTSVFTQVGAKIIGCAYGDYCVWATDEVQTTKNYGDNKVGKFYRMRDNTFIDVTGEFYLPSNNVQVEISAQRDLFVIYFSDIIGDLVERQFPFIKELYSLAITTRLQDEEGDHCFGKDFFSDIFVHAQH
ncbi:hypothetical protein ABK040_008469 [Willaertia magna]